MKTTANDERRGLVQSEEESGVRSHDFANDVNHVDIDNAVIDPADTDTTDRGIDADLDTAAAKTASSSSLSGNPVLHVEHLSRTYAGADRPAVNDISFTLNRGECLGLVGESGCGKSTLARCLLRIEDADKGSITLGGQDIAQLSGRRLRPHLRKIQIVFQNPMAALNPKLKIADSLIDPYEQLDGTLARPTLPTHRRRHTSKSCLKRSSFQAIWLDDTPMS